MAACTHGLGKSRSSLIDPSSSAGSTVLIYISLLRKCCYSVVVEIIYRSKTAEDTLEEAREFSFHAFCKAGPGVMHFLLQMCIYRTISPATLTGILPSW